MANFISEDDIERDIIKVFRNETLAYDYLNGYTVDPEDFNDGSKRSDKKQVVLLDHLESALRRLNRELPESAITAAIEQLTASHTQLSAFEANKQVYQLLRDGVQVEITNSAGRQETMRVKVLDFDRPEQNDFLLVAQLWIKGKYWRRPDLLIFVNGLPLVMIELKNSNVSVKCAFDDNLTNYKRDIPELFVYNALTLLSNARETRISGFDSAWEHFSHWLRVDDEEQRINRKQIADKQISLDYAVRSLFQKDRLLDFIENFILYHDHGYKVVAKNHQFFGVNKAVASVAALRNDGKKAAILKTASNCANFWVQTSVAMVWRLCVAL